MQKILFPCVLAILSAIMWASPTDACIHAPPTYKESLGQSAQEAILLHADGIQSLILKVKVKLHYKRNKRPNKLAWIVTIPARPRRYSLTSPSIFKDLFKWRERLERVDPNVPVIGGVSPKSVRRGLVFRKKVRLGAYSIQPVQGSKKSDAALLNKWLTDNGFEAVEPKQLHYFLENKFTFLCIKIDLKGARTLSPLRVTFPSKKLYYPLKFSSHQGTFDLHLYTITKQPLSHTASLEAFRKLKRLQNSFFAQGKSEPSASDAQGEAAALLNPYSLQRNVPSPKSKFPRAVQALLKGPAGASWYANYIHSSSLNANHEIKRWRRDIFFTLGESAKDKKLRQKKAAIASFLRKKRMRWSRYKSKYGAHMVAWAQAWQGKKPLPKPGMGSISWWLGGLFGAAFLLFLGVLAARRGKEKAA